MRFELIKTSVFVYRAFSKLAAPAEIGWQDIMTFILVYIIQISSKWPPGGVQVSAQVRCRLKVTWRSVNLAMIDLEEKSYSSDESS